MGRALRTMVTGLVELDVGAALTFVPGLQGFGTVIAMQGLCTLAQGATHPMRICADPPRRPRALTAPADRDAPQEAAPCVSR